MKSDFPSLVITPGNVDNGEPLTESMFLKDIFGKLFADKGYISDKLFNHLLFDGIHLITTVRKNMKESYMTANDRIILRLSTGGLMLFHGFSKLINGVGPIESMLAAIGLPSFIAYGALLTELVASLMIVLGAWTRAAAVAMVGNMVVAVLMAHAANIFTLTPQGGWAIELPMLYLLPSLALIFTGGGRYSLTRNGIFA